jgi:hypothetical protein
LENFYVYIYLDPRKPGKYVYGEYEFDYEPFYVGKGKENRAYNLTNRQGMCKTKIKSLLGKKLKPIILLIKVCLDEELSFSLEKELIFIIGRQDKNTGPLLNMSEGGDGNAGKIFSEEHRRKKSEAQMGIKNHRYGKVTSVETKQKLSAKLAGTNNPMYGKIGANKGVSPSEETRKKISQALTGRIFTEEWKNKISATKKAKKEVRSDDFKRRVSEAQKNVPKTEEHRQKISQALKNKPKTKEHCLHSSESHKGQKAWNKGIPHTEETKKKISEALLFKYKLKKEDYLYDE